MFHRHSILSVLGLCLGLLSLRAQTPDAEALLESWQETQLGAYEGVGPLEVMEHSTRLIHAARGQRTQVFTFLLSGVPGQDEWERHILSAEIDGRPLDPERQDRLENRFALDIGLPVIQVALFPARWINRLRLQSGLEPDHLNGVPAWRIELDSPFQRPPQRPFPPARRPPLRPGDRGGRAGFPEPRDPVRAFERVTVWFTQTKPYRLLQAHVAFRLPHHVNANLLEIDYGAFDEIDVPQHTVLEGLITQRRRLTVYTVRVHVETVFSGYRRLEPDERP